MSDLMAPGMVMAPGLAEEPLPTLQCPECPYTTTSPAGLGRHRRAKHGVIGQSRASKTRHAARAGRPEKEPCPVCQKPITLRYLAQHIARKHSDEPQFTADDIFVNVVSLLYPDESIPVAHLPALIEWREATGRMLEAIAA